MNRLIQCLVFLLLFATSAHAVDYSDARVTSIGIMPGEDRIRFTIDKDQYAIFLTDQYTGEQLKRLVALVMTAYTAQSPVYRIRSSESASAATKHYTNVILFNVGSSQTWD